MKTACWPAILLCLPIPAIAQDTTEKPDALRLFDYKPRTMLKVIENPVERAKFPAVNVHTHLGGLRTADQVERLVRDMDHSNVAVTVSLDGMWGETLDKHLELLTKDHAGRFVAFAQIDYRGDGDGNDMASW